MIFAKRNIWGYHLLPARHRFVVALLLLLFVPLTLAGLGNRAWAQDPPADLPPLELPEAPSQEPATEKELTPEEIAELLKGIPQLVTEEPYNRWRTHTGKPEECVVLIDYKDTLGADKTATGLVIRCDGFILVPPDVVDTLYASEVKASVRIRIIGAEGATPTKPLPVIGRIKIITARVPYGVIKVEGYHLRCLPLLAASNVQRRQKVRILKALPTDKPWECKSASPVEAIVGVPRTDRPDIVSLSSPQPDKPLSISPGEIVVDSETDAAIGLVLHPVREGLPAEFITFENFNSLCNEVGLAADREAIKERASLPQSFPLEQNRLSFGGSRAVNGLLWIPGGPTRVRGSVAEFYRKAFKTNIVCMPGYFIGEYVVTNREYYQWMLIQKDGLHTPESWKMEPDPTSIPRNFPNYPVCGVPMPSLFAFLATGRCRLPTSVEWQRAALCQNYVWGKRLMDYWDTYAAIAVRGIQEAKLTMLGQQQITNEIARRQDDGSLENLRAIRDAFLEERTMFDAVYQRLANAMSALHANMPWFLMPVGSEAADKSIFGLRDATMNCPEVLLPIGWGIPSPPYALKPYTIRADQFASYLKLPRQIAVYGLVLGQDREATDNITAFISFIQCATTTSPPSPLIGERGKPLFIMPVPGGQRSLNIQTSVVVYPGFRKAR